MPASYPSSAKAFTTKVDGPGNTILAAHINDLQNEVTAVEQDLIAGLPVVRGGTGALTHTNHGVLIGQAASAVAATSAGTAGQVLTSNGASADPTFQDVPARSLCQGRLTLTTGVPVTTADVTAATTIYWALYAGNQIALYTGSAWQVFTLSQLSIAVPSTTDTAYDVFVDYNAGTPALSLTAWTNVTTRATALTTQDGVLVLTGTLGKRYVGSFCTTGVSGQTEDSEAKRYLYNYYHRQPRPLKRQDSTASWPYSTATWRQANAAAANQVDVMQGVAETPVVLTLKGQVQNDTGNVNINIGIGEDSTSAPLSAATVGNIFIQSANGLLSGTATLNKIPAVGKHVYTMLEGPTATGITTFYGGSGSTVGTVASNGCGLFGWCHG